MLALIKRWSRFLFGRADYVNLDQRLVYVICLGGAISAYVSALENYLIGAGLFMTLSTVLQATLLAVCYIYSRVTGRFRAIIWPILLSILVFLAVQWFYNAGSKGGAQYFIFICGLLGVMVLHGWQRILIIGLYIATANTVLALEYFFPSWVIDYTGKEARYFDIAFSYTVCLLLTGLSIGVLSSHYQELVRRVRRQRTELIEDMRLAKILQQEIFRHDEAKTAGYDFSFLYRPSTAVGGDFYEVSPLSSCLRILLADLKGHGVNAALSSMIVKSEWVHSGHETLSPGEALTSLNKRLIDRYPGSVMLSATVIDIERERIRYSSAAQPVQYVVKKNQICPLRAAGIPIGLDAKYQYGTLEEKIDPGTRILLFTDALVEEFNQQGYPIGDAWIKDVLGRPFATSRDLLQAIQSRFQTLTGKRPGETADDLTVIVISGPRSF